MKQMKKTYRLFPVVLGLLASVVLLFSSCDKMNDIQAEWAGQEEQVYLGKVDSVRFYPGFGRAKITWYIGADPKVDRTIIYWNMRQDSIVKEFVRTGSGLQRDSVILENLPVGSTLFEFRNVNNAGETSLYSNATVTVWGPEFATGLRARRVAGLSLNPAESVFGLNLTPTTQGDSVEYAEVVYTNTLGQTRTVRADRATNELQLSNFPAGGEFRLRTVFFPPQGIDTVYNNFEAFQAPSVVTTGGTQLAFTGVLTSKYFDYNGESLYEWTSGSALISRPLNGDGTVSATGTEVATVPRATYRDLIFYDADRYITVTTGNVLRMLSIQGSNVAIVNTPTGTTDFGTGFSMPLFLSPVNGVYFYSLTAAGVLQAWYAFNNASLATPNNAAVATGYQIYDVNKLAVFDATSLLIVDSAGDLWALPVSVSGRLGSRSQIGSGWNRFARIVTVGTTVLGIQSNGEVYAFPNFSVGNFWVVN